MAREIYPYTEEELQEFGDKVFKALKKKYPQIDDIKFSHEKEERWKDNWHILELDINWREHRKMVLQRTDKKLTDDDDRIIDMDAFSEISHKLKREMERDIKFVLNMFKYKTRDIDYDPHISM